MLYGCLLDLACCIDNQTKNTTKRQRCLREHETNTTTITNRSIYSYYISFQWLNSARYRDTVAVQTQGSTSIMMRMSRRNWLVYEYTCHLKNNTRISVFLFAQLPATLHRTVINYNTK